MSRVFDGVNGNFLNNVGFLQNEILPLSWMCWFKADVGASAFTNELINYGDNTKDITMLLQWVGATAIRARNRSRTNGGDTADVAVPAEDVWHCMVMTQEVGIPGLFVECDGLTNTGGEIIQKATGSANPDFVVGARSTYHDFVANGKIAHVAVWDSVISPADIAELVAGTQPDDLTSGTANLLEYWPLTDSDLTGTVSSTVLTVGGTVANDDGDNPPVTPPSGGPVEIDQAITSQTSTTITLTSPTNVLIEPTLGAPQDGLPYTAGVALATGSTLVSLEQVVTNVGLETDSRAITLSPPAGTIAINTMIAEAVTIAGSVFDTVLITVEDNMQASIPAQIALPTTGFADLTMTPDGVYNITFSGGGSEEEFNIPVTYYSPDNKQMSFAEITVFEGQ